MITTKTRLTTTVDHDLVRAGLAAVAAGRSKSLSGWVNAALAHQAATDRRLAAMAGAVAAYEAEQGDITPGELARQARADRQHAIVIRGRKRAAASARRHRRAG